MLTERSAADRRRAPAAAPVPAHRDRRVPGRGCPGRDRGDRLRQGASGRGAGAVHHRGRRRQARRGWSGPRSRAGVEVTQVTERAAAALSDAVTPQGIVVRCAHPQTTVADVLAGSPTLVAVLVQANDPGNAGTVIRLADAAGADGVILAGDSVDPFNPKAIRASAGSLFHLPVARAADPAALLDELSAAGLSVLATTGARRTRSGRGAPRTASSTCRRPGCSVPRRTACPTTSSRAADEAVRVPIYGRAESLNLASAAAICLYASASAQRRSMRSLGPAAGQRGDSRSESRSTTGPDDRQRDGDHVVQRPGQRQRQPYRCRSRPRPRRTTAGGSPAVSRRIPPGAAGTPGRCSPRTAGRRSPISRTRSGRTRRCPGAT